MMTITNEEERMARRTPPRKVTYFDPVAPRLGRNTIGETAGNALVDDEAGFVGFADCEGCWT
jgi:hypothetical protein